LESLAVVIDAPGQLAFRRLALADPSPADVLVEIDWSGISTGTERLLWEGRMPDFPGLGYPLVPGYESVGRVVDAGPLAGTLVGQTVFVPGADCFRDARGLFGGAARYVVLPAARVLPIDPALGHEGALLALAATALHALGDTRPDVIVGHGVLGRLLARLAVEAGGSPVVWETDPGRRTGAEGYRVSAPDADDRFDYAAIVDASGSHALLDTLVGRLARGGEIVLAGFYGERLDFAFPPAFRREARFRIAAEFRPADLAAVRDMAQAGRLSLAGLVTHRHRADEAGEAYPRAFADRSCLKMLLDWRAC
jgi:3-hydroxyethyl bacteriochlorophyllide a dehydrogenase